MNRRTRLAALAVAAVVPLSALAVAPSGPATSADSGGGRFFERTATYPVYLNVPAGVDPALPTVAEISAATPDGRTLVYTDGPARRIGFLDTTDPTAPVGTGTLDLSLPGDAKTEATSVAIKGDYAIAVVDTSASFTDVSGRAMVVRLSDRKVVRSIALGGMPDSITVSPDGAYAAVAMENERNESINGANLPQLPPGFLQVLSVAGNDPAAWTTTSVPFTNPDGSALASFTAAGLDTPVDPEPEFVTINAANKVAVTLQENNGIVVVDLPTRAIERVFSAGKVDLTNIDTSSDGVFNPTGSQLGRVREPDSIAWVGTNLVATANEGDWKGGTRGWSVFDTSTGLPVWDAGNSLEQLATRYGLFNNARAASKGIEVEGMAFATMGGTPYVFVGSERSNFVAVYDMTNPLAPAFTQLLPTTNGPEGVLPIPGANLLAVSSETDTAASLVRASVSFYRFGATTPNFPQVVSADVPGVSPATPIGWGALGTLTGSPTSATTLYSASDSAYKPGRIYTIDAAQTPARITAVTEVKDANGTAVQPMDIEGLAARPGGGFWAASEGATGDANKLYRLDATGVIQETVDLPTEVSSKIRNWGYEGVTVSKAAGNEVVYVAIQRPLWTSANAADPLVPAEGNVTRIGRYDTVTKTWTWYAYPIAQTSAAADWIGVSEVVAVDGDTLAVLERDKLNGPSAALKRIYTVDLPGNGGPVGSPTRLTKTLARDLLPDLRRTNGWTQEKVEGLTIAADGRAYAVTDNDGLTNATGETVFMRLGDIFGLAPAPVPSTPAPSPSVPAPTATPAPVPPTVVLSTTSTRLKARAVTRVGARLKVRVTVKGATAGRVRLMASDGTTKRVDLDRRGRAVVTLRPRQRGSLVLVADFAGGPSAAPSLSKLRSVLVVRRG